MPDQPDDPIHYDMKIPPEPQNATLNQQDEHKGSDEVTHESNRQGEQGGDPRRDNSKQK
jgi:hypothetical protein